MFQTIQSDVCWVVGRDIEGIYMVLLLRALLIYRLSDKSLSFRRNHNDSIRKGLLEDPLSLSIHFSLHLLQ
jgi:hypothetical protein